MKLDEIIDMWATDCVVDDNHLGEASSNTPVLHAKYLKLLMDAKQRRARTLHEYNTLRKNKFRYYRGEMSREELKEAGWEQWQYAKPLKNEMDEFLKGDEELAKIDMRLEYIDAMIYALESIMNQIKQRSFDLKNAITWKQFLAGM